MRWLFLLCVLAACPRPRPDPPQQTESGSGSAVATDPAPVLAIVSPERGSFQDAATLVVRGTARDDGAVRVTVNGGDVPVGADGAFTATLQLASGLTIVETHAIDATGHDTRDVRAVLVGPFGISDGSVASAIGARVGPAGLRAIGTALATSAKAIDFSAAAKKLNPVYDNPGCLGARVDIAEVAVGKIAVALIPRPGVIETAISVDDIVIKMTVAYEVACIGGRTSMTVRTKARLDGALAARLVGRRIETAMPRPAVTLDNFQIDIGGLPGPIQRIVRPGVRIGVEVALIDTIANKLPPLADARLAELFARPHVAPLLGRDVEIDVVPRKVELATGGLSLAADTRFIVRGGEAGRYVAMPGPVATGDTPNLGVAFSVDAINQLFAGLWAARAFERTVAIDQVGPLRLLLDGSVATVHVAPALPPTTNANGSLELAIGDLIITAKDGAGEIVQQFVVSLRTQLAVKPNELALATTSPTVHAQVLAQRPGIERPLDAAAIEGVVGGAWWLVDGMVNDALSRLPLPALAGALDAKLVGTRGGAIVLDIAPR
jgi:hypothetical protein